MQSLLGPQLQAAALHDERATDSAATAFVLTDEDLHLLGYRTLLEALRSVPGLYGFRDDLFPMIGVRGMGLLNDYGTRMLILVDGHPLDDSVGMGGTLLGPDLPLPIEAIKRIEVVKGPVGSLYGPNAFLGLVNIVTWDADDLATQARAGGQLSQGRLRGGEGSAVVTAKAGEVGITAGGQVQGTRGDDVTLPELLQPLPARSAPGSARLADAGAARASAGFARLRFRGLHFSAACSTSTHGLVAAAYGSIVGDHRNEVRTSRCFAEGRQAVRLSPEVSLDLRASYDQSLYQDAYAYPPPPESSGVFRDAGRDRWGTADVRVTWTNSLNRMAIVGVTGQLHQTLQSTWADDLPTVRQDPENGTGSGDIPKAYATLNGYLLVEQRLSPAWRLHLGATWYWHELFGQRVTPKVAMVHTPGTRDVIKLIYSQGFRPPTAAEAFFDDSYSYLANPRLRPEVVDAGELSWQRQLGPRASVGTSAFLERFTREIRYVTVPAPGVVNPDPENPLDFRVQARNGETTWVRGGEVWAELELGRWVAGHGGVCFQEVSGVAAHVNSPSVIGKLALITRALWEPLALSATLDAVSARPGDKDNPPKGREESRRVQALLGAAAVLDLPGTRSLSFELSVANLLGAAAPDPLPVDYRPVTSLPQPPRTLRLGLRYTPR